MTFFWVYEEHGIEIFRWDGSTSLTEADKSFKEAVGKDVVRTPSVVVHNTGWPIYVDNARRKQEKLFNAK